MKKINKLFLTILLLSSCSNTSSSISDSKISSITNESTTSISSSEEFNPLDYLNDDNANGYYDKENSNNNRIPDDELYNKILDQKRELQVNETYIEDFEKDFLDSKLYVHTVEEGVISELRNTGNASIDNTSLYIKSNGNYKGVILGGMKFSKYATYKVEFDYKILKASNDFFFQFRTPEGGTINDIYTVISGASGTSGHQEFSVDLKGYNDYYIMLFPRNEAGTISFDNIKITRLNSKPIALSGNIVGDLDVNEKVEVDYYYFDSENDKEGKSEINWFVCLNNQGVNKRYLNIHTKELTITSNMKGYYLGCDVIVKTEGNDPQSEGNKLTIFSNNSVGSESKNLNDFIKLRENESFIEDFEEDYSEAKNIYFNHEINTNSYLDTEAISGNYSLRIKNNGNFGATIFSGLRIDSRGIYKVEFDYKFIQKSNIFYTQFRTPSGSTLDDVPASLLMDNVQVNEVGHFESIFGLGAFSDYYLMVFPGHDPVEVVIDNLKITRMKGYHVIVENVELNVGDKISEDFNDLTSLKIGLDYSQVPNSKTIDTDGIEGGSLYFESSGSYKCLFINKGLTYTPNATYKISFDYKIISFVDTLYFQLNNNISTTYKEFGGANEVGNVNKFSGEFVVGDNVNYVMQIFPGGQSGVTSMLIDNLIIERIK